MLGTARNSVCNRSVPPCCKEQRRRRAAPQGDVLQPERRQLLQERGWLRSRQRYPKLGCQRPRCLDHAAVVARGERPGKLAARRSNGGAQRLPARGGPRARARRPTPCHAGRLNPYKLPSRPRVIHASTGKPAGHPRALPATASASRCQPCSGEVWGTNLATTCFTPACN